ncbi:purple acid phosphatase [Artemisia annua]|uniref:Purple acid phosphatase n=1 Tax=Artemisia annua TaxID=35608 RepID=A0A2U1MET5_ARTAN|nr:purple acid phosphatase [Artemisia annua]
MSYANGYLSQWDQFTARVEPIASIKPYMVATCQICEPKKKPIPRINVVSTSGSLNSPERQLDSESGSSKNKPRMSYRVLDMGIREVGALVNVVPSSLRAPSLTAGKHVVDTCGVLSTGVSHGGDVTVTSHSQAGSVNKKNRHVTLDFQAAVIRHQMPVDDEGFGTLDDVIARVGDHALSGTVNISIAHTSRKRACDENSEDQRPSQRPRRQGLDVSSFRPAMETFQVSAYVSSSPLPGLPILSQQPPVARSIPTPEPGVSPSFDIDASAIPVSPDSPLQIPVPGRRTRGRPFLMYDERRVSADRSTQKAA